MAYTPNIWVDREGTTRYFETVEKDGAKIFTPDYSQLTEIGTPVNADNMNHIEEGIAAGSFTKYDSNTVYQINDLVTSFEGSELKVYKSLKSENYNNPVTDVTYWEEVALGGGGGLELGDIGIAPLGIDETENKRRYLNGQVIIQDQFEGFTAKLKSAIQLYPSLACSESDWQTTATMTVGGQVGKFVVDDEAGTIRLPKIIMPIQGLTDLSKLAEIVEAGLPNITGTTDQYSISNRTASGAFYSGNSTSYKFAGANQSSHNSSSFDASRCSSVYGNSNTVQQEQIQYPYFIQVATGAGTQNNITNTIELNNPYSFGDSKYSPVTLNNLSWLKSLGQWNTKIDYTSYYDWLLRIYNGIETVDGVSVKLSTEAYTDYDFVINTADETFRLPLLNGSESLIGSEDIEYELPDSTSKEYIAEFNGLVESWMTTDATNQTMRAWNRTTDEIDETRMPTSGAYGFANVWVNKGDTFRITCTKVSTITKVRLHKARGNGNLYFYVGETVQNANLINAGRIEEKLTSIIPDNSSLIAGYGIPDYSAGVAQTMGTQYTASCSGYVVFQAHYANNVMKLYVNGIVVEADAGEYNQLKTLSAYVSAGDTYKTEGGNITTQSGYTPTGLMFYPLKGAK